MGESSRRKLAVHGPMVELDCSVPAIDAPLEQLLGKFSLPTLPWGFVPTTGIIKPYDHEERLRAMGPSARHVTQTPDLMDLYQEDERYWLVDNRWGMTEVNFLRHQFRSWVHEQPRLDPMRVAELAVHWPMAQLLKQQGLHLLPAISVVRDGFAALMLCPFGVQPEMLAMINNGWRVIGQRWTAIREEDGRLALLHMPGKIESFSGPRLRFGNEDQETWIDVTRDHPGSSQSHAFCDAVVVVEPGRRHKAHLRETSTANALNLLHREWPMVELEAGRRSSPLVNQLVANCRCYELQLSRNSSDLLALLNSIRLSGPVIDRQTVAA